MNSLPRVVLIYPVNLFGTLIRGALVNIYRDGKIKTGGTIVDEPHQYTITAPGKLEAEVIYGKLRKRREIGPDEPRVRIRLTWWTAPKLIVAALVILGAIGLWAKNHFGPGEAPTKVTRDYEGEGPHHKAAVVVFVHGIFGDKSTWSRQETSFPQLLTEDPDFRDKLDVFVFTYYSPHFGPASSVSALGSKLGAALEDKGVLNDHDHIAFLCHSMGGLVVRRYLLQTRDLSKVSMIYFYATPTNGADVADIASRVSSNPELRAMFPLESNDFLQSIQNDWQAWPAAQALPSYCSYEELPTYGIFVVPQSSARALCTHVDPMTANHIEIVKPPSRDDERYTRFATALKKTVFGTE